MKNKKVKVGGVALFNGILFSSIYRQAQVNVNNGKIRCRINNYTSDKSIINKIPIIRGIIGLCNQIGNAAPEFINSCDEQNKSEMLNPIIIYMFLILALLGIPILISILVKPSLRTFVQCIAIIVEFAIYLVSIYATKELNTLFMYHGAEHKAVNTYENLGLDGMTLDNIKKQSRFHKRCGGNFVSYFIILTLISLFIPISNLILKYFVLILLAIFNIGIAYEIVNIMSLLSSPLDILNYPASLIQYITTKEPTDEMLKAARYGILASVRERPSIIVSKYIKDYIKQNIQNKEYDTQDIYSILEYITNKDRNTLLLQKDEIELSINQEIEADELLYKYYNEQYPLQYITKKQYFYNEEYYVDERVLIPRSDTEILVEKALEYIKKEHLTNIIDLCTGSGCIGISIVKNSDMKCNMELVDISSGAIEVAKKNILLNGLDETDIKVVSSNLLDYKIKEIEKQYADQNKEDSIDLHVDMIVSNPPYIKRDIIPTLDLNVQKEPKIALDGGIDGLDFYRKIIEQSKKVLKNNGILIFEIGYDQLESISDIIKLDKEYKLLESVKDYGKKDRVIVCRFLGK